MKLKIQGNAEQIKPLLISKKPQGRKKQTTLVKANEELTVLDRLIQKVAAQLSLQKACNIAIKELSAALHADVVVLFLQEGGQLHLKAVGPKSSHLRMKDVPVHIVGECLCGLAAHTGRMITSQDIHKDKRCTWSECKMAGLQSFVAIPMHVGKLPVGVLGIASAVARNFKESARFLKRVANRLAISIHHARLLEQTQTYAIQLEHQVIERKKTEAMLQKNRSDLMAILNNLPFLAWLKDSEGRFIAVNIPFAKSSGYISPDDLIGKTDLDIWPKNLAESYRFDDNAIMSSGQKKAVEEIISDKGVERWFETFKAPLFDVYGNITGTTGFARDISDRKQSEESLRASETKYRTLVESIPQKIFTKDRNSVYISCNENYARDLGIDTETIVGKTDYDFFPKELADKYRNDDKKVMDSGVEEAFEEQYVQGNRKTWVYTVKTPTRDKEGNIMGILGIFSDITERKHMEEQLHESEKKYRLLFNGISDAIYVHEVSHEKPGNFLAVNDAACRMLGYTQEEFSQMAIGDIDVPEQKDRLPFILDTLFKHGTILFETRHITKDRKEIPVEVSVHLFELTGKSVALSVVRDITERKQTETELLREKEFTEKLLESLPGIFFLYDSTCHLKRWNKAHETAMGFTADELRDWYIPDWHETPEDAAAGMALVKSVLDTGVGGAFETTLINKEGRFVPYLISITRLMTPDGPVMMGVGIDITERKQAEETLRKEKIFSDTMINSLPGIFYLFDENGHFLRWNRNFEIVSGYSSEEMQKIHPLDLFLGDEKKLVEDAIHEVFVKGDSHVEATLISKGGESTPYFFTGLRFLWDNSPYLVGMGIDITERKKAMDALQTSEAELHDHYFAEAAINMILKESLTDIPLEEILQKSLNMILAVPMLALEPIGSIHLVEGDKRMLVMKAHYNVPEPMITACDQIPAGKCLCGKAAQSQKIEFSDHVDDRHQICYRSMPDHGHYAVPILSGEKTLGVLNISLKEGHIRNQREEEFLQNIADTLAGIILRKKVESERERLHDQLMQAQKMEAIGTLAGGIAHDFNNLLMGILGYTSIMLLKTDKTHPFYEKLKIIEQQAESGSELTKQLLGFARAGKYEVKPVDINALIIRTSGIFGKTKKEIAIHKELQEKLSAAEADAGQIEQVLLNLYVNAWQAMPSGGNLYLETKNVKLDELQSSSYNVKPGSYVKISVTDTGVGMDTETRKRIFEPFFTTKGVGKGTGLGLASAYGIIKNHGGVINVYSEKGHGTTFTIYLPASGIQTAEAEASEGALLMGNETILIVDDEQVNIAIIKELLQMLGYKIMTAQSGKEAIEQYKKHGKDIHLVILDMIMPEMSGKETLIKFMEIDKDVCVLLASGYSINGEAKEILDVGCKGFIQKPFRVEELSQKIREVLDSKAS